MTLANTERTEQIVRYETERGDVALSTEMVRRLWCPNATPTEAYTFIQLCRFHRLNPHLREAYIIKYDTKAPASFVIGKEAWLSRAEQHPKYEGFTAGIILKAEAGLDYRASSFKTADETLLGGWCEVYRSDRRAPIRIEVSLQEYDRGRSLWNSHKATMIRKVAVSQAHREAFPGMFSGLYEQAEISDEGPLNEDMVVEGTGTWLPAANVDADTGEIITESEPEAVTAPPRPKPQETDAEPPVETKASLKALTSLNQCREAYNVSLEQMATWVADNYEGKTVRQLTDEQVDFLKGVIQNGGTFTADLKPDNPEPEPVEPVEEQTEAQVEEPLLLP
jgi:phage recombination protein Bet